MGYRNVECWEIGNSMSQSRQMPVLRQGYVLSPTMFLLAWDSVMKTADGKRSGIQCGMIEDMM